MSGISARPGEQLKLFSVSAMTVADVVVVVGNS